MSSIGSKKSSVQSGKSKSVEPSVWHADKPVDHEGLQPGPRKLLSMAMGTSQGSPVALPPVAVRRSKPGVFDPAQFKEITSPTMKAHGISSFAPPGALSEMKSISSDPRLSDMTVATVAANKIKGLLWGKLVKKAAKQLAAENAKEDKNPDEVSRLNGQLDQRKTRHQEHMQGAKISNATHIGRERAEASHLSSMQSDLLMTKGKTLFTSKVKSLSQTGQAQGLNLKESVAANFEAPYKSAKFNSAEAEFISRMVSIAPEMRASTYFNADDQDKMFQSGALFAKQTRKNLGMGNESKTTDTDATHLGNHDHVFFFMEHQDAPMRQTRFTAKSTSTGEVGHELAPESGVAPGARRLSFPLSGVMQEGTWAMKHDFLNLEGLRKQYGPHENMVASQERNPHRAAKHFMAQLAFSALDMSKNDKQGRAELLEKHENGAYKMSNQQFVRNVFGNYLKPQLMVPSVVPFNVKGARLDMPTVDLQPKHGAIGNINELKQNHL